MVRESRQRSTRREHLDFERCEDRSLTTLVFVLNGNAFGATRPNALTADAASVLRGAGHRVIELSTPTIATPAAFSGVVKQIRSMSHGQPIGIVGFSAGGSLAARLAGVKTLNVTAALNYYGPPDFRDYLDFHRGDSFYRYVVGHVRFTPGAIRLLSGPSTASAYVVNAFGRDDTNVEAGLSASSFAKDFTRGRVFYYPGPHGVSIGASPPALEDFLAHL